MFDLGIIFDTDSQTKPRIELQKHLMLSLFNLFRITKLWLSKLTVDHAYAKLKSCEYHLFKILKGINQYINFNWDNSMI